MLDVARELRAIRGLLPESILGQLKFVTIAHRPLPTPVDVARGAGPNHRGYFFGHGIDRPDGETTELPDEEPPRGEIVLFTERIEPLDMHGLAVVLLHEIGHALGYDHDVLVDELGLG